MRGAWPTRSAFAGALLLAAGLLGSGLRAPGGPAPAPVVADEPRLSEPTATGDFGDPLVFSTMFTSDEEPLRVELITQEGARSETFVRIATVEEAGGGRFRAVVRLTGHVVPNTRFRYRFRIVTAHGSVPGPEAEHRVADRRLAWDSLAGERMTIHWHRGTEGFARKALAIGEGAIDEAATLLGVDEVAPVDFFIYADGGAFREALGPGTREQVGGQANTAIRTLFGLIRPGQIDSPWVEELVRHELTHLVFDDAVDNPYHYPPRWLNEGLAVYLSAGYSSADRAQVEAAARGGTIIPLDGLVGQFPTTPRRFSLAYAISVSAVDHFVRAYGQERLASLITSYARGVSDDEAFRAATGDGFEAFDDAWLASVGATRPEPSGPRPAPSGPVPEAWRDEPTALLR